MSTSSASLRLSLKGSDLIPWFSRLVLFLAMAVFAVIGRKFVGDSVGTAAASHIVLNSPLAITDMRASFGAFPLGSAVFLLVCLLTAGRRTTGLIFVSVLIGAVLAVRLFATVVDGTLTESLPLIAPETVLLCLSAAALVSESRLARAGQTRGALSS